MQVFRTRTRRGHHHDDHRTNVTTNGSRIVTTNDRRGHGVAVPATHVSSRHGHRHGHRGDTIVVAENVPRGHAHGTHLTTSRDQRRYYRDDPSTIHGLWNKVLGTLTGNRRRQRHGDREMRKARERREALGIARRVQQVRAKGDMTKLHKLGDRPRRRHRNNTNPIIITAGRRQGRTPWLHHTDRTLPPYHGMHHKILGFFTRQRERRAMGEAMAAAAEEERRRERNRRREEMKEMGRRYRERGRR